MEHKMVQDYFMQEEVVNHYKESVSRVGLWISEKMILTRFFSVENNLLEIGCGAGRISIGLWELNFRNLTGIDYSLDMVKEAQKINKTLKYGIQFKKGNALYLNFNDQFFEGVIFGFNGMMQIPGRDSRKKVMSEVFRVLKPNHFFLFTTHDRNLSKHHRFWQKEKQLWRKGKQNPLVDDFGDRYAETPHGKMFMHVPTPSEIRQDLKEAGFSVQADALRSSIANEPEKVRHFSDECRFWVAKKK
jgi:ubiquinone/menaquinone biosynthesis C-methylase UbiE